MPEKSTPPWEKSTPKNTKHTKLTPASKAKAKASARRHGRSYPNLVDNMHAAKAQKKSGPSSKSASSGEAPKATKTRKTAQTTRSRKPATTKKASRSSKAAK